MFPLIKTNVVRRKGAALPLYHLISSDMDKCGGCFSEKRKKSTRQGYLDFDQKKYMKTTKIWPRHISCVLKLRLKVTYSAIY